MQYNSSTQLSTDGIVRPQGANPAFYYNYSENNINGTKYPT